MKASWQALAARYKALPPRDRTLLPLALCFGLLTLGSLLLVQPARKQLQLQRQQHAQTQDELLALQAQLSGLKAQLQNPDAALHAQLAALHGQTRAADDQFKQLQDSLVPAQEISRWLAGLLQAQRGLQVIGLRSLPVASVSEMLGAEPAGAAASGPSGATSAAPEAWLYRHGVELTLRGSYHDLLAYLNTLEHLPRRVYWGPLVLNAQDSPAVTMSLKVYTLSLEKTWWQI